MARRERERYTERNRPHRKEAPRALAAGPAASDGFKNPVVLIAVGGLVIAVFLVLGVLFGRSRGDTAATTTPTAVTEATIAATEGAISQSELVTDTEGLGQTEGITATDGLTATEGLTTTDALTGTGESRLFIPADGEPYAQPEDMALEPGEKSYFATIATDKGDIVVELWPEIAPAHVNAFAFLIGQGFYDGLKFHRVEEWVVQGGDPAGTGAGGPGYALPAEFNADDPVPHVYGTLAMARTPDPDSAGSQFYFIKDPKGASFLDGQYTVFGHVLSGMKVVEAIAKDDTMTKVTFEAKDIAERKVSPDDIRAGKLPEPPPGGATE